MKKKIFLAVSIIVILAVSVWGCMEVCAAKKPKWETAAVSIKIGTKTLEEESDCRMKQHNTVQHNALPIIQR